MKEGYKALEDLVVRGTTEEGGKEEDILIPAGTVLPLDEEGYITHYAKYTVTVDTKDMNKITPTKLTKDEFIQYLIPDRSLNNMNGMSSNGNSTNGENAVELSNNERKRRARRSTRRSKRRSTRRARR